MTTRRRLEFDYPEFMKIKEMLPNIAAKTLDPNELIDKLVPYFYKDDIHKYDLSLYKAHVLENLKEKLSSITDEVSISSIVSITEDSEAEDGDPAKLIRYRVGIKYDTAISYHDNVEAIQKMIAEVVEEIGVSIKIHERINPRIIQPSNQKEDIGIYEVDLEEQKVKGESS